MMSYKTFECGLNGSENPDKACCDICSGRGGCYDLIQEGTGDITESEHCVRCGDWWGDKGIICSECDRYFCPGFWQNFFIFTSDCKDKREEVGWDTMGGISKSRSDLAPNSRWEFGICSECFADHPEWWCDCDNSCNTSKTKWS
jgi:hypothetical protein